MSKPTAIEARTAKWVPFLLIGVVAAAGVLWLFRPQPSLEDVCYTALDCIRMSDAECIFSLSRLEDRVAYNLTPDSVRALMRDYAEPRLAGSVFGEKSSEIQLEFGRGTCTQSMVTANGKRSGLEVQVVRTDEGVRALRLVTSILLTVAHAQYENVGGNSTVDKLKGWQKQAAEDSKVLEKIGINGIFRSDEEGLITWDRWRLLNDERLARVAAQSGGDPTKGLPAGTRN